MSKWIFLRLLSITLMSSRWVHGLCAFDDNSLYWTHLVQSTKGAMLHWLYSFWLSLLDIPLVPGIRLIRNKQVWTIQEWWLLQKTESSNVADYNEIVADLWYQKRILWNKEGGMQHLFMCSCNNMKVFLSTIFPYWQL